jgi:hypothetical protein
MPLVWGKFLEKSGQDGRAFFVFSMGEERISTSNSGQDGRAIYPARILPHPSPPVKPPVTGPLHEGAVTLAAFYGWHALAPPRREHAEPASNPRPTAPCSQRSTVESMPPNRGYISCRLN